MDKKLYDIVYNDIIIQFSAGDYIEDGDREACAEQIVEDLEKVGYRKADEVRKETAKEILQKWYNEDKATQGDSKDYILEVAYEYGVEVDK